MAIEAMSYIYVAAGIISALFLLFIAFNLAKQKTEIVKAKLFLHYPLFKTAFYILTVGALFVVLGHIGEILNIELLHELGESLHDVTMLIFAVMLYFIMRARVVIK
jgi:hypothetical protein